jgi:hypothetical protein
MLYSLVLSLGQLTLCAFVLIFSSFAVDEKIPRHGNGDRSLLHWVMLGLMVSMMQLQMGPICAAPLWCFWAAALSSSCLRRLPTAAASSSGGAEAPLAARRTPAACAALLAVTTLYIEQSDLPLVGAAALLGSAMVVATGWLRAAASAASLAPVPHASTSSGSGMPPLLTAHGRLAAQPASPASRSLRGPPCVRATEVTVGGSALLGGWDAPRSAAFTLTASPDAAQLLLAPCQSEILGREEQGEGSGGATDLPSMQLVCSRVTALDLAVAGMAQQPDALLRAPSALNSLVAPPLRIQVLLESSVPLRRVAPAAPSPLDAILAEARLLRFTVALSEGADLERLLARIRVGVVRAAPVGGWGADNGGGRARPEAESPPLRGQSSPAARSHSHPRASPFSAALRETGSVSQGARESTSQPSARELPVVQSSLQMGMPSWAQSVPPRLYSPRARRWMAAAIVAFTVFQCVWALWQLHRHFEAVRSVFAFFADLLMERPLRFLRERFTSLFSAMDTLFVLWTHSFATLLAPLSVAAAPLIRLLRAVAWDRLAAPLARALSHAALVAQRLSVVLAPAWDALRRAAGPLLDSAVLGWAAARGLADSLLAALQPALAALQPLAAAAGAAARAVAASGAVLVAQLDGLRASMDITQLQQVRRESGSQRVCLNCALPALLLPRTSQSGARGQRCPALAPPC